MATIEIYYVDDDVDDIEVFTDAIKSIEDTIAAEITIKSFSEGEFFLKSLRKREPQNGIIFLDINMPVKNGFQVLSEIRKDINLKNIPVVMYSTSSNGMSVDKSFELGAHLYAIKPRSFDVLKDIIKKVLAINWAEFHIDRNNFIVQ
jgi:CheY-like chemotaxis protein